MRSLLGCVIGLWLIGLMGCAGGPQVRELASASIAVDAVPFHAQEEFQCGPAALAMVLGAAGVAVTPDELTSQVYLPQRHGSLQIELQAASRRHARVPYVLEADIGAVLEELRAQHPVLVLLNQGLSWAPVWHYAVVIGYQPATQHFILHSGRIASLQLDQQRFLRQWALAGRWAMVVTPPDEVPATADAMHWLAAVAPFESAGALDVALDAYRAGIARWTDDALIRAALGNVLAARSDWQSAAEAYAQALQRNPGLADARNNYAYVLARLGCRQAALREVDRALLAASATQLSALRQTREEILSGKLSADQTAPETCPAG